MTKCAQLQDFQQFPTIQKWGSKIDSVFLWVFFFNIISTLETCFDENLAMFKKKKSHFLVHSVGAPKQLKIFK